MPIPVLWCHYAWLLLLVAALGLPQVGCNRDDDDDTTIDDTTTVVLENELNFRLIGGPDAIDNKTVLFSNFYTQQTNAGYNASIGGTEIEAVAQWNNTPAYLHLLLPDTLAQFYKFEETLPPTYPTYPTNNKYIQVQLQGALPLEVIKFMNIKITEYGPVGGRIKGTLNGSFYDYTETPAGTTVNLVEGEFDFLRTQ